MPALVELLIPKHLCILGATLVSALNAHAQWSSDSSINTLASGSETGCAVTHAVATPAGETWVAWYDSSSGYDLRVQRLDSNGVPVLAAPLLVADQSLSWVQDFDIARDTAGRLAIAWVSNDTVGASLINLDGTVAWHHTFGGQGAFMASAQIIGTNDGDVVVGWAEESTSRLQRVDSSGALGWDAPIEVAISGTLILSDLKPSADGSVIASFVHYLVFSGSKRLKAQRFDAAGAPLWSGEVVDVFTSGSLQYGNFPEFIADGSGGAVFTWYSTSPLMARAQWIDETGTILLGSSGTALTTESSMVHVAPAACMDATTGEAVVLWIRQNSTQSQAGVHANRMNRKGDRRWGTQGIEVTPLDPSTSVFDLTVVSVGERAIGSWIQAGVTGVGTVYAAAIDGDGTMAWGGGPLAIGTPSVSRDDQTGVMAAGGFVSVWADERSGTSRSYAQRVDSDGTLGGSDCPADLSDDGAIDGADLGLFLVEWGVCSGCVADLTGDGFVDGADLGLLLTAWGPC